MRLPDANVLLNARNANASGHREAVRWVERSLSGSEPIGFTYTTLLAFIRISTNPRLLPQPLQVSEALDQVDGWLGASPAVMVEPAAGHFVLMRDLLESVGTAGDLATDAHLAAIAIERGAIVASFDADFSRFSGLDFEHLRA